MITTLLVGALISSGGCSSDADRLDRSATEQAIQKVVQADLPEAVERVTCPETIPLGEGKTVRCQVALADVAGAVGLDVEQMAGEELDVTLLDAVIDPVVVADELERQLLAIYLRPFTADCGPPGARAMAPASTLSCTVTDGDGDGDGEREATATVDDAAGTLRFSVADPQRPPEVVDPPSGPEGPVVSFEPVPDPTADGPAAGD